MPLAIDDLSKNALGGTELMKYELVKRIPKELLDKFQIFVSRVQEPLSDKHIRLYWITDLPGDPASEHLANGGWSKFHKLIFVSHWQMQRFIERHNIPWSMCTVMLNAIEPLAQPNRTEGPQRVKRLVYTPTPHRGLEILTSAFETLQKERDDLELHVFSSFKIYGWGERDEHFKELFERLQNNKQVVYHGFKSNKEVKTQLPNFDIFAYPSIWPETSCITLMEAMSAGLVCVHPAYGALPETAMNLTLMYDWHEDQKQHENIFTQSLRFAIDNIDKFSENLKIQKLVADILYNWNVRERQWLNLLVSLSEQKLDLTIPQTAEMFHYKS